LDRIIKLKPDATVIDVGASFGPFSIDMARRFPRSRVLAFEPLPSGYSLLRENIALNAITNIETFPLAVEAQQGRSRLFTSRPNPLLYGTVARDGRDTRSIEVEATSLNAILSKHGIDRCDLLKIDCEGAEYAILFGTDPLALAKVEHIALEYHDGITDYNHEELVAFLMDRGYSVRLKPLDTHRDIGYLFAARLPRHSD
jgi:FkbM family methyltransferase